MKPGKSLLAKPGTGLSLDKSVVVDIPGHPQVVTVTIENTTAVTHTFYVELLGLQSIPDEASVDEPVEVPDQAEQPPSVDETPQGHIIHPGGVESFPLVVKAPVNIAGGCHLLAVRAWTGERDDPEIDWYAELRLEIPDGRRARIDLKPAAVRMRHSKRTEVSVENLGSDRLSFELNSVDPEGVVKVRFRKKHLEVPPYEAGKLTVDKTTAEVVITKWKVFGDPVLRVVDIKADGPGVTHSKALLVEHRPIIPMWLVRTIGSLILLVAMILALIFLVRTFILDNPAPQWRELESGLEPRANHTAVWVEYPAPDVRPSNPLVWAYRWGRKALGRDDDFIEAMIVWGGGTDTSAFGDGEVYLVGAQEWRPMSDEPAPTRRLGHTAVWSGKRMIIWGGKSTPGDTPDKDRNDEPLALFPPGGAYDPHDDKWDTAIGDDRAAGRHQHTAVWSNQYGMIVWGGTDGSQFFGDGYIYCDPSLDDCKKGSDWKALPTIADDQAAPTPRAGHVAEWTGTELVIWGGYNDQGELLSDGAAFNVEDWKWKRLEPPGSDFKRRAFAESVWTDDNTMMILGGIGDGELILVHDARKKRADDGSETGEDHLPIEIARRTSLSTDVVIKALNILDAGVAGDADRFRRLDDTIAILDPDANKWASADNPPPVTRDPVAIWTASKLRLVFAVPEVDTITSVFWVPDEGWERLPLPGPTEVIPSRTGHTAVWIRGGLVVWGGRGTAAECPTDGGCFLNDGGLLPIAER